MTDKGFCHQCQRKILNTTHQKCMYCGAELPQEQQFSQDEIAAIQKQREKDKQEEKNLNKSKRNSGIYPDSSWRDISGGDDCGGSDSSC